MFVETEVEIEVKDKYAERLDDHGMKLWVQRAFKDNSCYRLASFKRDKDSKAKLKAVVAISTAGLPEAERNEIEKGAAGTGRLRSFVEKMFAGQGVLKVVGEPQLKAV